MSAVLFLTSPDDALPQEFARQNTGSDLAFLFGQRSEWCIAWVNGQAWLEHIAGGPEQSFFLGTDPQKAMQAAARLIASWELPGTGKPN